MATVQGIIMTVHQELRDTNIHVDELRFHSKNTIIEQIVNHLLIEQHEAQTPTKNLFALPPDR